MRSSRISAAAERARAPGGQSRTTSHAIHQSFWVQAVAREDLLVALKVDRVGQLTEHLADDLIRVPRTAEEPRGFLVKSGRRIGRHTMSIRSRSQAGGIAIAFVRPAGVRPAIALGDLRLVRGLEHCWRGHAGARHQRPALGRRVEVATSPGVTLSGRLRRPPLRAHRVSRAHRANSSSTRSTGSSAGLPYHPHIKHADLGITSA